MTEQEYLQTYDISNFDRPSVATDIVLLSLLRDKPDADIRSVDVHALQLLLIRRGSHPYLGKWALPGGFSNPAETVYETAKRELLEETNVTNAHLELDGIYSDNNRDPRGWIISNAWLGLINIHECDLRADTDAWEARWFTIQSLDSKITHKDKVSTEYTHTLTLHNSDINETLTSVIKETLTVNKSCIDVNFTVVQSNLAFDHDNIVVQTLLHFFEKTKEDIRPIFNLLPDTFTLGQLQATYELITGKREQNFRRMIVDYVVETGELASIQGFRPAKLFSRNNEKFKYR